MNLVGTAIGIGLSVLAACLAPGTHGESGRQEREEPKGLRADMPGANHRLMEPFVGTFDTEFIYFPPGAPAVVSKGGTMVNSWVMDGRFLKHEFVGDFGGAPFRGVGYWGYSNTGRTFEGVWIDNVSTAISFRSEGRVSEDGRVFTTEYEQTDPATGRRERHRDVTRLLTADRHTWTSSLLAESGEVKQMEAVYTRRRG